ncbi:MAG TPA: sensor histidine kinase [Pseudonocardiaceae bacterium]|jgi:signal transduction histidine kinase|nr:sensor histidine kinase [Pseudonocardiaceae bacterium]
MSSPKPRYWMEVRGQPWPRVVTVGPYVLLAVLVAFTSVWKRSAGGSLVIDLGLSALAAVWMLWLVTLHPAWRERPPLMVLFFAGLIAIMAVLVLRDPWFGFFTPAGYFYAFRLLPWPWLPIGVAGMAMVAGTAQASDLDKTTLLGLLSYVAVLAVNVLPMSGFAWFSWYTGQRNDERNQALEQLSEANRKLEATLAENAVLQERLLSQAREAGVHDERQRMAREIHDTLAQGLTGIITQLQAAEQADADVPAWHRHVDAAIRLARESLTEARRSVHALRPEPLRTARLGEALADVAQRWSALNGLAVEVTTTGTARPLLPAAEVALLRTAQEALANVAKHARASRVGMTLSYMEHEVALDVRDDGRGFDPAGYEPVAVNGSSGGFGLVAMRQRIEGLSGTLQVESEPGGGTAISACVPAGVSA